MAQLNKQVFLELTNEEKWELFRKSEIENVALREVYSKLDILIDKITKLESDVEIAKTVNKGLTAEIIQLKRKINRDSQYHRQENLEISGIPQSISDENLEETTIKLLSHLIRHLSFMESGRILTAL